MSVIYVYIVDLLARKSEKELFSNEFFWVQVLEQRVETLERELDAAISAAARARTEKREAEAGQKAAELRAQEITKELENTTSMHLYFCGLLL